MLHLNFAFSIWICWKAHYNDQFTPSRFNAVHVNYAGTHFTSLERMESRVKEAGKKVTQILFRYSQILPSRANRHDVLNSCWKLHSTSSTYNPGQNFWHIPPPPHSMLVNAQFRSKFVSWPRDCRTNIEPGGGGWEKIVLGSSGGYTMCMTDDISKNGQY